MIEYAENKQEQEMFSLGTTFMGFLMGIGTILGIWLLSGLVQLFLMIMG
jgi:hypothetical protein